MKDKINEWELSYNGSTKAFYWKYRGDYILRVGNFTIGYYSKALNNLVGWFLFHKGKQIL
jgi:hypothetical protein